MVCDVEPDLSVRSRERLHLKSAGRCRPQESNALIALAGPNAALRVQVTCPPAFARPQAVNATRKVEFAPDRGRSASLHTYMLSIGGAENAAHPSYSPCGVICPSLGSALYRWIDTMMRPPITDPEVWQVPQEFFSIHDLPEPTSCSASSRSKPFVVRLVAGAGPNRRSSNFAIAPLDVAPPSRGRRLLRSASGTRPARGKE